MEGGAQTGVEMKGKNHFLIYGLAPLDTTSPVALAGDAKDYNMLSNYGQGYVVGKSVLTLSVGILFLFSFRLSKNLILPLKTIEHFYNIYFDILNDRFKESFWVAVLK